ncbi:MAG: hypothetical protein KKA28_18365 [Planctomycetes bacterium]|nr:hypothetical protein [Planctomycetota bacterium]MCG2681316.1 hypothetical protein [Kiritimatiellia bacterium]
MIATSKEMILATIARQQVDRVPCVPHFWSSPTVEGYAWTNEEERLHVITHKLGTAAMLHFGIREARGADAAEMLRFGVCARRHPDVREKVWRENRADEKYPLIHKEVTTPKGTLEAIVRETEDWPHGLDIPFFSDFNVSRYVKPWLASVADVEKWAYVYLPPEDREIGQAREAWRKTDALREKFQVPIVGTYTLGLSGAQHLFGAEPLALLSMDQPEAVERYLEILDRTDRRCLEVLLDFGVDIVRRNGWYESTDFWSPSQFRRFVAPRIEKESSMAHEAGRPFIYTMCTGIMPLLPILSQLNFDSLDTIEPVLGKQDMPRLARELGDKKCLWGGVSAPIHIGMGKPEDVRAAVRRAFEVFGKRGFILTAVPTIRPQWPWENVLAMIDEWQKLR